MYLNIFYERPQEDSDSYIGILHLWDDALGYKKIPAVRYAYKLDPQGQYKTLYGQSVKKVRRWSKTDEESGVIFESDVSPEMRYLVDNYTEYETPSKSHVELFFDIEVDTVNGLPDMKEADNEITAISYYDKNSKEYVALILDKENEIEPQDYTSMQGEKIRVLPLASEQELLEKFMANYNIIKPTILTGWNIDNFDVPYLYNRMSRLFGTGFANKLSPINLVHYSERRERYFIAGVSCMDYMYLYKNFTFGERISFSLDAIGKLEVGMGKIKYDGTLNKLFKEDKEKFIEYNIHDVRIVVKIDEKLKFIDLAKGICHKGHVPYEDIYFSSRYLDGAILTYMKIKGLVAPNRPNKHHKFTKDGEEGFEGAYVKEPIPGKYRWIVDLDAQSLYPSIIMSLNISPETKITTVNGWNSMAYKNNKEATYTIELVDKKLTLDNEKMHKFLSESELSISSNGVLYNTKIPGIIPEILSRWFDERVEYKNLMKKFGKEKNQEKYEYYYMRQYIQKVILNSLYGVLGLPTFRFYDLDNAAAVTLTGQDLIKFAEKIITYQFTQRLGEEKDYIIYVDTDSCFFSVEPLVKKQFPTIDWSDDLMVANSILSITKEIQDYVNKSMDYFSLQFLNIKKHRFYLKQELVAKSGFWTAKKRYALNIINKEGLPINELEVKGLDVVRTSFPKVFRDFMTQILKDILADVEKEIIDKKIIDLKSSLFTFSMSDLARPTGVKDISKYCKFSDAPFQNAALGTPVHVKSSINYNSLVKYYNLEKKYSLIRDGEKIKWLYLRDNPYKFETLAFRDNGEDPKEVLDYISKHVDLDKVFESELVKKLNDFYKALNWGTIVIESNKNVSKFF